MSFLDTHTNIFCEKCNGRLGVSKTCAICGHNNSNAAPNKEVKLTPDMFRSTRLTIMLVIFAVIQAISYLALLLKIVSLENSSAASILFILSTIIVVFEMVLFFFMFKLKKWARNAYIVLIIIDSILRLLQLDFPVIIFRALLLYFTFIKDWDDFV